MNNRVFFHVIGIFPPLLVFQKVCGKALGNSLCYVQTFWSPTAKAPDEE